MSHWSNQPSEKKRTFLELIESSDEDDDDLFLLVPQTGRIFNRTTNKTKPPDNAPSSLSSLSAFPSETISKSPTNNNSCHSTSKSFPVASASVPDMVGSLSITPRLVKSATAVPVTVESSSSSSTSSSSPIILLPPTKIESSYAQKTMQVKKSSSVKSEPMAYTALRATAGPVSSSSSPPSPRPTPASPTATELSLLDVKPAALSTLTPLGYVTFPTQDSKWFAALATMMTIGQSLTMSLITNAAQPHDDGYFSIGLYDRATNAKVGLIDERYAPQIVPLLRDRAATMSLQCTVVQCMPGLRVLVRIEVFFKSPGLAPPPMALLHTNQAELQEKLQKFGWTAGIAPSIHPNTMGAHVLASGGAGRNGRPMTHQTATTAIGVENFLHNIIVRAFDDETDDQEQLDEVKHGYDPLEASFGKVVFEDFLGPVDDDTPDAEVQVDVEKLDKVFDALQTQQLADLPQVDMPKHLSSVVFYKYQEDGIRWLLRQEQQECIPPWFVQRPCGDWICSITGKKQNEKPSLVRGSILADDMGLGKTLQTLALFLLNPPKGQLGYPYVRQAMGGEYNPRTTLIVAPVSVMSAWLMQINKHVNKGGKKQILTVMKYNGPKREDKTALVQLNQVDILLTTYGTLASDFKKYNVVKENDTTLTAITKSRRGKEKRNLPTIFDLHFHRVVLDEAHIIRNSKTGYFKACQKIQANHRLCLTGTPFVNRPYDIQSLLQFLQVEPLCGKKVFDDRVTKCIVARNPAGLSTLRTTMACIALRRTKADVLSTIKLVSKTVEERIVPFPTGEHKRIHDMMYLLTRFAFIGLLRNKDHQGIVDNYMQFMELILRVRQSCCHAGLVSAERLKRAESARGDIDAIHKKKDINPELAEFLLAKLRSIKKTLDEEQDEESCAICLESFDKLDIQILKECKHVFCSPCLEQNRSDLCPLCRTPYTPDDILTRTDVEDSLRTNVKKESSKRVSSLSCRKHELQYAMSLGRSPKIQALLDEIEKMAPDEKAVIFSQWTSYLDVIEQELRLEGHFYCRIDGTMSADNRLLSMEKFDTEETNSFQTPRFILCSLNACGTGITLNRGNVVFMMDPWWNAAAENQAMDRVHRIGQMRPVRVVRFLMKGSIETRMMALQESKSALGKGSLQKLKLDEQRKARIMTLHQLLDADNIDSLWDDNWKPPH